MTEDYRVVQWGGAVIKDTAVERRRREDAKASRNGEPFSATTDCPDCGKWDTHWLSEPRLKPEGDDPVSRAQVRITELCSMWAPAWDPPGSSVVRTCTKCGYRWAQA